MRHYPKCIDCNKQIAYQSKRCKPCADKYKKIMGTFNGKNNPAYKTGETLKKHYCIECKINEICLANYFNGSGLCQSCAHKGKNNPNYKNGKAMNTNEYYKEYNKYKRNNDINFRLMWNLRSRLNNAIKNNVKTMKTIELIGCSIKFLKLHLEKQFKEGMSWLNIGKWHIDHIRPCSSFDLSDPEQQKICFHYTNLQPLWAKENLIKGAKF